MNKRDYEEIMNGHVCDNILSYEKYYREIRYDRRNDEWIFAFGNYMLADGAGIAAIVPIDYCPYCGKKLPDYDKGEDNA